MTGKTILIVEDDGIIAARLHDTLTRCGYTVPEPVASGEDAIAAVAAAAPDLVLMDIELAGAMNGTTTAEQIRADFDLPIIYLTAYSEEKTVTRAKATKPYGYLLKPFSDRELHIIIQVTIERYENDILLKKNEQHFRLALEAARLGTWEVTRESHEIFMGKSPQGNIEPISGWESFFLSIDENHKPKVADFIDRLRTKKGSSAEIEFRVNPGPGKSGWYKLYGKSFKNSDAGKHQIVGILQETTESRIAKDRLAQAATVFNCASEGIIILNKNRKFNCANSAFYKLTKFQPHHLRNKELPFLTSLSLGENTYNSIWQGIEKHGHWRGEITACKKNKAL